MSRPSHDAPRRPRRARCRHLGLEYSRYLEDSRSCPRGTVEVGGRRLYGYPHIGRILALRPGLAEQFEAPVWAEEKIEGYNVRICRLGGRALAFTRGGFLCPFTTDRLPDLIDLRILEDHPDLVICAEVAGPDNPYLESSPPFIAEDVRLFVFDLMRLDAPGFLPTPETYALADRYGLPGVQRLGRFGPHQVKAIQAVLRRFNVEGREGLVFKEDRPGGRRAKYVTSSSSVADIRATSANIMELPAEYYTHRILRLVLFLREQGLERSPELDAELGAAFLEGLMEALRQYEREGKVYRRFRCRLRQRENAQAMLAHLQAAGSHQVQISLHRLEREDGYWLLEFDRQYAGLNGLLGHLLGGGLVFD